LVRCCCGGLVSYRQLAPTSPRLSVPSGDGSLTQHSPAHCRAVLPASVHRSPGYFAANSLLSNTKLLAFLQINRT
jgi:hypothetical protein